MRTEAEPVKEEGAEFSQELDAAKCSVLVVDPDNVARAQIVRHLKELGFSYVSETESHETALRRFQNKKFTHVIFSTVSSSIHYHDFLRTVVQNEPDVITLPMAPAPNPDQVYEAIMLGARGFIVVPCEKEALQRLFELSAREELALATELQNLDRNKVLASLMCSGLDDIAEALRKSRGKVTKDIQSLTDHFRSQAKMARSFCQGGEEALLRVVEEHLIKQSFKIPTRLGKIRRKMAEKRKQKSADSEK